MLFRSGELPPDTDLQIDRLTPAAFPIYSLNLSGGLSPADLHDYGYYVARPALNRVPGVGKVEVLSSDTREMEVIVDPARMLASGLTIEDVSTALKQTNLLEPIGRYPEGGTQYLVLASGLWENASQIANTPIVTRGGGLIKVGDVANVTAGAPDRTTLVVGSGGPSTAISISQQVGANILSVRAGIEAEIAKLAKEIGRAHVNSSH